MSPWLMRPAIAASRRLPVMPSGFGRTPAIRVPMMAPTSRLTSTKSTSWSAGTPEPSQVVSSTLSSVNSRGGVARRVRSSTRYSFRTMWTTWSRSTSSRFCSIQSSKRVEMSASKRAV